MKWFSNHLLILILISVIFFSAVKCKTAQTDETVHVSVMTFNIRLALENGNPQDWINRKRSMLALVQSNPADFIGMQEAVPLQVEFFREKLPEYEIITRSREADPEHGEAVPLLYNKKKWKVADSGHFWLSDTPEVPGSNTWGNSWKRMVTWGKFVHNEQKDTLLVVNTHFDNVSQPSREKSVRLTLDRMEEMANGKPVIFLGDLNVRDSNIVIFNILEHNFIDTYREANPEPQDIDMTFHGWKDSIGRSRIDYIFARGHKKTLDSYVIREHEGDIYPSDHFAVISHIVF